MMALLCSLWGRRSCRLPALSLINILLALPATAADHWIRLTTTHFEMYTTSDEKKAREAILHFERVRDFFLQASPVRPPGEFPVRIVAFKDPQVFHIYAPGAGILAYYAPGPVRDTIAMQDPSAESYPVTIHEYVHLVIRHSGLHIPLWLNEGWAQVYETLKPVRDGVAVGDLIPGHIALLGRAPWFSLDELGAVNNRSPDYHETSRSGMFYAESWALAHMLYLSPEYKNNFGKFISALNKGRSMDEAVQTTFGKTSAQVFLDMQTYLSRKKLYGTVFLTPFEKSGEAPVISQVTDYDANLMLADLNAASHHFAPASRSYQDLEAEDPKRPAAFESSGYLAVQMGDKDTARREFAKAFALGSTDPQLCVQLAALEREAGRPQDAIMAELDRAVKLRPDFSEALFVLGIMKVDARDFDAALAALNKVGAVAPESTVVFHSALAYANLQKGNLDAARRNAEASRAAARTPEDTQRAERLLRLIDARSKGPAAALPGERLVRAEGTAVGLRCVAPGSATLSKIGINVGGRQMLFDMPDQAAVEIARQPGSTAEMKCGVLQPFPVVVEYAPASVLDKESAGLIRRLEF